MGFGQDRCNDVTHPQLCWSRREGLVKFTKQPLPIKRSLWLYSSSKGSAIFLEDLREAFRGRGIGRAILSEVARIARQEGSYGIRWEVLGWNESAIRFYKSLGGEFFDEWRQVLLEGDALNRLADG